MPDKREEILNLEHRKFVEEKGLSAIYPKEFPKAYKDAAINAMDENGKQMCFDLLEYMAKNNIECVWSEIDGGMDFFYKGSWITKEQLFENFL